MAESRSRGSSEKAVRAESYPIVVRDAVNRFVMLVFTSDFRQRGRTIWLDGVVDDDG